MLCEAREQARSACPAAARAAGVRVRRAKSACARQVGGVRCEGRVV